MNADKIIHEAMGLCWHSYSMKNSALLVKGVALYLLPCMGCRKRVSIGNPDYSQWHNLGAVFDWMREGEERIRTFHNYLSRCRKIFYSSQFLAAPPGEIRDLIAEWIESEES